MDSSAADAAGAGSEVSPDAAVALARELAQGVLELYEPSLATVSTHLKELTCVHSRSSAHHGERQESVHFMIVSEKRKLDDLQNDAALDALLADVATNREKLVSVSSSMMSLHRRVQSLQSRASNVEKAARQRAATTQAHS